MFISILSLQEDHPSTKEGRSREGNVKTITPNYKLGSEKPVGLHYPRSRSVVLLNVASFVDPVSFQSHELKLGTSGYLPNEKGDYKVGRLLSV